MSNISEQPCDQVFENLDRQGNRSTYLVLGGIGLVMLAIVSFIGTIGRPHSEISLHLTTTLPMIIAVGMLAQGYSVRSQPSRIVVGPDAIEITEKRGTRRYAWSQIGSAFTANILNSHKTCLCITDKAGTAIIRIHESFPEYQRLVKLVESYIDAKPDDASMRITTRKAKRTGVVCFAFGCFLGAAAVFIALATREGQRANELLSVKGVPGEGEIVRRFVAPNGVTKRIEFRLPGSKVKNVEVDPILWDQLQHAETVRVIYVPDEPDISRLEVGEVKDNEFLTTPLGGYLLSGIGGLLALAVICVSPIAWMGYDLGFDGKQRIWRLKRYGRVVWASKKEAFEQAPPNSPPLDPR